MNQDTWHDHVDERFDRLEGKFDEFLKLTLNNTNDLAWVKGSLKAVFGLIIGIISTLVSNFIRGEH